MYSCLMGHMYTYIYSQCVCFMDRMKHVRIFRSDGHINAFKTLL